MTRASFIVIERVRQAIPTASEETVMDRVNMPEVTVLVAAVTFVVFAMLRRVSGAAC